MGLWANEAAEQVCAIYGTYNLNGEIRQLPGNLNNQEPASHLFQISQATLLF